MRATSAAQSPASSPPTPWRTSTITSFSSAGSCSTSESFSSSSSRVEIGPGLAPGLRELVRAFELLPAPADRRRLAVVVVDGGIGLALERFVVRALQLLDELFERSHG